MNNMSKTEFEKLPKVFYPTPVADVAKKFYTPRPEKYLAKGLLPDATRGAVSKLGGTAVQPKAKR
jgi:hypothetical protein